MGKFFIGLFAAAVLTTAAVFAQPTPFNPTDTLIFISVNSAPPSDSTIIYYIYATNTSLTDSIYLSQVAYTNGNSQFNLYADHQYYRINIDSTTTTPRFNYKSLTAYRSYSGWNFTIVFKGALLIPPSSNQQIAIVTLTLYNGGTWLGELYAEPIVNRCWFTYRNSQYGVNHLNQEFWRFYVSH